MIIPTSDMLVRYVLRSAAVATLLIGFVMIFSPAALLNWFGSGGHDNRHFALYLGTALIGFSLTNWLYSRVPDLNMIKPAIYGNLASILTATIIDVKSLIAGSLNQSVWLILLLHILFVAAFLYCLNAIRVENLREE